MERDELPRTEPRRATRQEDELKRNEVLARYDAHPGIAVLLLAVMAFLFIVATYQLIADRIDNGSRRGAELQAPQALPKN